MTAEEIMSIVDINAVGYTLEEKRHFHRFFLHEYCSGWMAMSTIAKATGVKERSMVYRSIKIIQEVRSYWLTAHQINHIIKKKLPKLNG